jgi:hypothetical protein
MQDTHAIPRRYRPHWSGQPRRWSNLLKQTTPLAAPLLLLSSLPSQRYTTDAPLCPTRRVGIELPGGLRRICLPSPSCSTPPLTAITMPTIYWCGSADATWLDWLASSASTGTAAGAGVASYMSKLEISNANKNRTGSQIRRLRTRWN